MESTLANVDSGETGEVRLKSKFKTVKKSGADSQNHPLSSSLVNISGINQTPWRTVVSPCLLGKQISSTLLYF